jgi:uncharacterized protein (TIGR02001 family)
MTRIDHFARTAGVAGAAMLALAGTALADGYGGSVKDAPAPAPARTFSYSVNAAVTTDYVFRGFSQSSENPAVSAGLDVTYGLFYAGFWGSSVDFDNAPDSSVEFDVYAGIKPVLGPVTFDFGVIGYLYPGTNEELSGLKEIDYFEVKAGASITPFTNAALGAAVYYSPEGTLGADETWTVEGTGSYTFAAMGRFTPSISGTVGYFTADQGFYGDPLEAQDDDYVYWNAGAAVAFDKFTLDVRYWDTDVDEDNALGTYADERVVGTLKVVLP